MSSKLISPTIYGIETEYSVLLRYPEEVVHEIVGSCHSSDTHLGLFQEPEYAGAIALDDQEIYEGFSQLGIIKTESGMLSNGGRFYMDPSGPEYDTPETSTAEEAVHRTFEGDYIMNKILNFLRNSGSLDGYQLNRRIVDHNRSSRGIHLNTSTVITEAESEVYVPQLAAINVAKGAVFGSGGLLLDQDGTTAYHHSPRLSLTNAVSAKYTNYKMRPLVRLPFKPESSRLRRVETVTSDALSFAWPLRASLIAANAVIKLIELKRAKAMLILQQPVFAAHNVGRFGNACRVIAEDRHGKSYKLHPVDIIRGTCELILHVDAKEGFLDAESKQVIPEIIDTAELLKRDETAVANRVESVARKMAIYRKMESSKVDLTSDKICKFDYYWDWIGGGLAETLREKRNVGWHGFQETSSCRKDRKLFTKPPTDTRANIRGMQIATDGATNQSTWEVIEFGDHSHYVPPNISEIECMGEVE